MRPHMFSFTGTILCKPVLHTASPPSCPTVFLPFNNIHLPSCSSGTHFIRRHHDHSSVPKILLAANRMNTESACILPLLREDNCRTWGLVSLISFPWKRFNSPHNQIIILQEQRSTAMALHSPKLLYQHLHLNEVWSPF